MINEFSSSEMSSNANILRKKQKEFAQTLEFPRGLGIKPLSKSDYKPTPTAVLRRKRQNRIDEKDGVMALVNVDGVLRWRVGGGTAPSRRQPGTRRSRRKRRQSQPAGEIVERFAFQDLPPNEIARQLRNLDHMLTPRTGLFELTQETLDDLQTNYEAINDRSWFFKKKKVEIRYKQGKPSGKKILLFIHGTFSSCENVIQDIYLEPFGSDFLRSITNSNRYDQVLAFNHPTVSISPVLNATTLSQIFRGSKAEVDIICHSRGGLVTRWWKEVLDQYQGRPGKIVFAGSPLAGTGLAAPHRLKSALDLLTNISNALSWTGRGVGTVFPLAAPFGHAAATIFSLFGKAFWVAANTPIVDAGVALVPGLNSQSRVGSNEEIIRLRNGFDRFANTVQSSQYLNNYHFILSEFQSDAVGWKFWRHFRKDKLAEHAADMIFEGPNDLVVDTLSMTSMSNQIGWDNIAWDKVLDFGVSNKVHHCNYFRQPESIDFIRQSLKIS